MKGKILAYLEENNLSQNALSKQLGISNAQLNMYLNNKYKGDIEVLEARLNNFFKQKAKKLQKLEFTFVETRASGKMRNTIEYAHIENEICVITGDAGLGKTYVLQEYRKQNAEVLLIDSTGILNVKGLLVNICKQLNINEKGYNQVLFDRIVEKLKGTNRLILIDEAENLNTRNLEVLRRLHDFTECGLVLAGKHELLRNLMGKKKELRQLYSRVAFLCDIGYMLDDEDIGKLASSYLSTNTLNDVIIKHAKGSARRVKKIVKGALRIASLNNVEVNKQVIENITKMLID